MKLKVTKKQVRDSFSKIVSIGYCDAQYLLKFEQPFAYSSGVYGWSCDYYDFGKVCVSTGYHPIGDSIKDYNALRELDNKARAILHSGDTDAQQKIKALLNEFLALETK